MSSNYEYKARQSIIVILTLIHFAAVKSDSIPHSAGKQAKTNRSLLGLTAQDLFLSSTKIAFESSALPHIYSSGFDTIFFFSSLNPKNLKVSTCSLSHFFSQTIFHFSWRISVNSLTKYSNYRHSLRV